MEAIQLDLFGDVAAEEIHRHSSALSCLAEAHPHALEILIGTRTADRGEIKQGKTGRWVYSRRTDGFYFELVEHWSSRGGWHTKPAHHITWDNLDDLTADDSGIAEIRDWSRSLTAVDAWKDRYRPFELHPDPGLWHPSYITGDHARSGWPARLAAWTQAIAIYRQAAERLS